MAASVSRKMATKCPFQHYHRFISSSLITTNNDNSSETSPKSCSQKPVLPTLEPSNDADLMSQILLHHHKNPFHALESSLKLNGISLSPHLLHQTLLRLRNFSKSALSFFDYAISSTDVVDAHSYNLLIDILAKDRQFDVVWRLIVEMYQCNDVSLSSTTFLVLIRRLIAAGFTRQAVRAFDDIDCFVAVKKSNGVSACSESDFCYLLDTLCKYGYVKVATEVFNKRKFKYIPDAKMYTALIYGWCKINQINIAQRLLEDMINSGIEPNVVTYNVLLNGVFRKTSLHPDDRFETIVRLAERLFDEMRERGIEPDVTSYSIVLHVYSRAHKPQLSLDKLQAMKDKGISPTVATYTSVVKCLCSCGKLDDAEKLLSEMFGNGVTPCATTYNCFFKEYRGRKNAEKALELYRKMKENYSSLPNIHTYNILISMFVDLNKMENVKEIWDDVKENGGGPDFDSYTLLIHGLCTKQKWREASEFFVEMIERGFLPEKVTFETLYRGLIQSDKLKIWGRLKKKLDEDSLTFASDLQIYHLKPYRRW